MIKQRGALRHISNQTLQVEIDQSTDRNVSIEEPNGTGVEDDHETSQVRQEKLWKAREEMLQRLAYVPYRFVPEYSLNSIVMLKMRFFRRSTSYLCYYRAHR